MARTFDGVNDNLLSANNAIPALNVSQKSISGWVKVDVAAGVLFQLVTQNGAGTGRLSLAFEAPDVAGYKWDITANGTTSGVWKAPDVDIDVPHHLAFTYDRGNVANDPVFYVDGAPVTVTETATPVALFTGDDTLKLGETGSGGSDLTGSVAHFAIQAGVLWDAAAVNRARWWGRPHGGLDVYHPFLTSKLVDEGTAAETLTATGTTVTNLVTPCVRPGSAMLGLDVGW